MSFNPVEKPKKYCRCGCGEVIGATKKWVSGHNLKTKEKNVIVRNQRTYKKMPCSDCGVEIERRLDGIKKKNRCVKCRGKLQSKNRKGVPLPSARTGVYRNCKNCGDEFYVTNKRSKSSGYYCSRKCASIKALELGLTSKFISSADNSGKKNGRYKHGNRVGGHVRNKDVREQVIEREGGYWCMWCGNPQQGLHLHRIKYASQGGKYEVDNCVILCPEHHGLVHSNKNKYMPILIDHVDKKNKERVEMYGE